MGRKQISHSRCVNICDSYSCAYLTVWQKAFMVWLMHGGLILQMHYLVDAISFDLYMTPIG